MSDLWTKADDAAEHAQAARLASLIADGISQPTASRTLWGTRGGITTAAEAGAWARAYVRTELTRRLPWLRGA